MGRTVLYPLVDGLAKSKLAEFVESVSDDAHVGTAASAVDVSEARQFEAAGTLHQVLPQSLLAKQWPSALIKIH
jgi:hypothetical protein